MDLNIRLISLCNDENHEAEIIKLIKQGANLNYESYNGHTPLTYSVKCKTTKIAKLLLQHGADVNYINKVSGQNVLNHVISRYGNNKKSFISLFIKQGIDLNKTNQLQHSSYLIQSITFGKKEIVGLLLKSGADVNAHDQKSTVLMTASSFDILDSKYDEKMDILKLILSYQPDLEKKLAGRQTALEKAWMAGNKDAFIMLLQHGADPKSVLYSQKLTLKNKNEFTFEMVEIAEIYYEKQKLATQNPQKSRLKIL